MSLSPGKKIPSSENRKEERRSGGGVEVKEKKKVGNRKEKGVKIRNDHSIQIKSPIKFLVQKEDLTFRNLTESLATSYFRLEGKEINRGKDGLGKELRTRNAVEDQGYHAKQRSQRVGVSEMERGLVEELKEICGKLKKYNNECLKEYVGRIEIEVGNMIGLVSKQRLSEQNKKIKTQKNSQQNNVPVLENKKQLSCRSGQIKKTEPNAQQKNEKLQEELRKQSKESIVGVGKNSQVQAKQQLEVKKIMYMLDGKNKNSEKCMIKNQIIMGHNYNNSESECSLSSFQQSSNDESGFVVCQIDRFSSDRKLQTLGHSEKEVKTAFRKGQGSYLEEQIRKRNKMKGQSLVVEVNCNKSESVENQGNICTTNKRKVLNDIVSMLNTKYNKNIHLA